MISILVGFQTWRSVWPNLFQIMSLRMLDNCSFHLILVTLFLFVFGCFWLFLAMKLWKYYVVVCLFYFSFCPTRLVLQTENIEQKITQLKWWKNPQKSYQNIVRRPQTLRKNSHLLKLLSNVKTMFLKFCVLLRMSEL